MTPELKAAIDRARNYKMTPQEIFEQRVSFVSEGKDKDRVRRQMIEMHGYPAEASEREAIVAHMRDVISRGYRSLPPAEKCAHGMLGAKDCIGCYDEVLSAALDAIEAGAHIAPARAGK